jgi:hypothetical protein
VLSERARRPCILSKPLKSTVPLFSVMKRIAPESSHLLRAHDGHYGQPVRAATKTAHTTWVNVRGGGVRVVELLLSLRRRQFPEEAVGRCSACQRRPPNMLGDDKFKLHCIGVATRLLARVQVPGQRQGTCTNTSACLGVACGGLHMGAPLLLETFQVIEASNVLAWHLRSR